ncbi:darcynin family protein [Streptacidiphilus sp. P02-A3a]|uniref:darcynin family protein n=1 Tax=Streptacidiphilus sp. P02-A3a TaxID=2704468 RepID=UPI0015FAE892|nr:darcynin family protein [Streptacidiphilus sp. P02-A3a]QMU70345.1 darcynin [Streptacidiphilus sp. P02-A3a]
MPAEPTPAEPTPAATTEPPVTAFILVKTTPAWLALTVPERVTAFTTQVLPAIEARTSGVRSRFYDTEFYSARVTDVWVWEAEDHHAYQLLIDALRETPFWDHYFEVVDLLVGTENGYARSYGLEPVAGVTT